jgi:hypothetical protein
MFGNNGKRLVRLFGARITFSSEEHRFVVKKFAVKKNASNEKPAAFAKRRFVKGDASSQAGSPVEGSVAISFASRASSSSLRRGGASAAAFIAFERRRLYPQRASPPPSRTSGVSSQSGKVLFSKGGFSSTKSP